MAGLAAVACSSQGDDAAANESMVTSADGGKVSDGKIKAAAKKLTGAWTTDGDGDVMAWVIRAFDFGDGSNLSVSRDTKRKKQSPTDKNEADRSSPSAEITVIESDTIGSIQLQNFDFRDSLDIRTIETYRYEVKGDKLTLTQTKEVVTETKFVDGDGEQPPPVTKENPVRPPFTLTKADSWCALADNGNAMFDCQEQFGSVWKPTDTPASCKDKESNCMRCEQRRCKMVKVSPCELDGKFCFESPEACMFQDGIPAGQVTTVSSEGKPVSCDGSRLTGKKVCCENIFFGRGEGEEFD
jgi:hypothetical protein